MKNAANIGGRKLGIYKFDKTALIISGYHSNAIPHLSSSGLIGVATISQVDQITYHEQRSGNPDFPFIFLILATFFSNTDFKIISISQIIFITHRLTE